MIEGDDRFLTATGNVAAAVTTPFHNKSWKKRTPLETAQSDLVEAEEMLRKVTGPQPPVPEGVTPEDWAAARDWSRETAQTRREDALAQLQRLTGKEPAITGGLGAVTYAHSMVAQSEPHEDRLVADLDPSRDPSYAHLVAKEPMPLSEHHGNHGVNAPTKFTAYLPGPHITINSARLIDSMTLRRLDGEAYKNGRKALDLRSNSVASDNGMHVLTIERLDFYPMTPAEIKEEMTRAQVNGESMDAAMAQRFAMTSDTGTATNESGRLGIVARVSIHPGLAQPSQRIMDTLSVDMAFWLENGLNEAAVMGYCTENHFTVQGHALLMSLQVIDAKPEETARIAKLNEILIEAEESGESPIDAMTRSGIDPDEHIPLAYQVSNEEVTFGA